MTNGAIDEPAETPCFEFPRRALTPCLRRAVLNVPAGPRIFRLFLQQRQQEQHLTLDMHANLSPSLFETLNCLQRGSQKLRQLFLCLLELLAVYLELLPVHGALSLAECKNVLTMIPHCGIFSLRPSKRSHHRVGKRN